MTNNICLDQFEVELVISCVHIVIIITFTNKLKCK